MFYLNLSYLADMNLSPQTVEALQAEGLDIIRVSDVMPGTAKDLEILHYARSQGRILITQDLDFSRLIAIGGYAYPSLVTLRLSTSDPTSITQMLRRVLPQVATALSEGCAVTIDDRNIRVRSLPVR